jgi:hypothetical protein
MRCVAPKARTSVRAIARGRPGFRVLDQLDGVAAKAQVRAHVVPARLVLVEEYVQAWNSVSGADLAL